MSWMKVPFGKHGGKTLPQIVFADPDWFFWLVDQGGLYGRLAAEAALVDERATSIILKERAAGSYEFEWLFDSDGRFCRIAVVDPTAIPYAGSTGFSHRTEVLDLSLLRRAKSYDKGGYRRVIRQVRRILFGAGELHLTKARCEAFFNERANFE